MKLGADTHFTSILNSENFLIQSFIAPESILYNISIYINPINITANHLLSIDITDKEGYSFFSKEFECLKFTKGYYNIPSTIKLTPNKRYLITLTANGDHNGGIKFRYGYRTLKKELFVINNSKSVGELDCELNFTNKLITSFAQTNHIKDKTQIMMLCDDDVDKIKKSVESFKLLQGYELILIDNSNISSDKIIHFAQTNDNVIYKRNSIKQNKSLSFNKWELNAEFVYFCEAGLLLFECLSELKILLTDEYGWVQSNGKNGYILIRTDILPQFNETLIDGVYWELILQLKQKNYQGLNIEDKLYEHINKTISKESMNILKTLYGNI